ncbi:MAG TPA: Flp pilus assembly protein CpaB [Candidatus Limnocylindrales bacterium]|nr:Flp pilus assembly protein CpaB [Candidatus Limnocylindrales bacterium]
MLIAGVILAAASFVAVLAFGGLGQQQAPTVPDVDVVVAAVDLPLGATVAADQLSTVTRPMTDAEDTYAHTEDLVGMVVRRAVVQGQAFTPADFQTNTDLPQVAASLPSGLRAVAIPLDRVDSVGALLQPGDWVDVLLSIRDVDALNPVVLENPAGLQVNPDGSVAAPYYTIDEFMNNTTVKVVVQKVQVLAALPPQATDGSDPAADPSEVQPDVVAVLAVTPQQSEVIRFAQLDGHVSLALRSPADYSAGEVSTSGITLQQLVDTYGVLPPAPITAR